MMIENKGENLRQLTVGDYVASLERRDPYGFWHFSWPKGEVPTKLNIAYTNPQYAAEAMASWFEKLPPRLKPTKD